MAITQDDFKKIWASTSSVPEYTFSDSDYQDGWEFVGNLPPTRAMWDTLQRRNDQKMKFLQDNGSMCFDSVADMVASDLESGQTVITKGYYCVNDGGSALYTIRAKDVADVEDGNSIIFLDNGNVAEKIKTLEIDYTNDGWFRFGIMDKDCYCNGMTTDGTNFYVGFYNASGGNSYIGKYDNKGVELARYTADNSFHYNSLAWDNKNNCIYALKNSSTIQKFDSSLNLVTEKSISPNSVYGIAVDTLYGGIYGASRSKIYRFDNDFNVIKTIDAPFIPAELTEAQGIAVYGNRLFVAINYPNTVFEFDLLTGTLIKETKFGSNIDNTYLGEIESVEVCSTGGVFSVHVGFALTICGMYYNTVFSLKANDIEHYVSPLSINTAYVGTVVMYVDSQSQTDYSTGTANAPWKSFVECMAHTANRLNYRIFLNNAHSIYDNPDTEYALPPITAEITYAGTVPNSRLRYRNSNLYILWQSSATAEISIRNSIVRIDTTYDTGDPSNLTVTARSSDITIIGDVQQVYNVDGIVKSTGKIGIKSGDAANFTFDSGNAPSHQLSISVPANSTVRLKTASSTYQMTAIVSCNGNDGANYNHVFFVNGYGTGGTARTFLYEVPVSASQTIYSATVDSSSNAVIIAMSGNAAKQVTVTATILSGNAQNIVLEKL